MCCSDWSKYTLRKQLLLRFGGIVSTALLLAGVICIIFINVTGSNIKTSMRSGFLSNAETDVKNIILDAANLFDKKLERLTNNFPNVMTFTTEDTFRSDNPFGFIPSYYNWPDNLPNAFVDPRYHANITLKASSINVFNKTINDVPTLSSSIRDTINRTAAMDYLFVPTFQLNNDFFAGYIGTPSKFLRYYPGAVNNTDIKRYIAYSPVGDYWYDQTVANPRTVIYTSPYYDPIAGQLMITISQTFHNPESGVILGAFGADLILTTLQNDISQLTYLPNSRTLMVEKSTGYIIADSRNVVNRLLTYNQITAPSISSDLWTTLSNNQQSFQLTGNYYLLSRDLKTSQNQYMLIVILDQDTILDTFATVLALINNILVINVVIVAAVFVGMFLFTLLLVICLTHRIVSPLQQLADRSRVIAGNLGKEDLFKGVEMKPLETGFDEIDRMQGNFNAMVTSARQPAVVAVNRFYQNPVWGTVPPPPLEGFSIIASLSPSAPQ